MYEIVKIASYSNKTQFGYVIILELIDKKYIHILHHVYKFKIH